ncbi:MAG: DUF4384 domain-containing protein, partial [Candidatus Krumholzibacteria bacterium]|nr:DUF4384 domain-containing protein [Candidatus Krumholzibacteria bacterium]
MTPRANALMMALIAGTLLTAVCLGTANAGVSVGFSYTSRPADIRVWLERDGYVSDGYYEDEDYYNSDYDVYPSSEDVVLYVRASRSCYATVYVVDTAGYIHVVHPLSPYDDAYLRGGRIYRFYLDDFDFHGGFDRGVAYAYAVCSPVSFNYARFGLGVFGPNFGFRIYGDPYVASREFYLNLIPASCDRGLISISHARFYVRRYVRYPSYLCVGWHDYYGVRNYCRGGCSVYKHYSTHVRNPYRVLDPTRKLRPKVRRYGEINRTAKWKDDGRSPRGEFKHETKTRTKLKARDLHAAKPLKTRPMDRTVRGAKTKAVTQHKVIKSSKKTFVKGKKDISDMRRQLKQQKVDRRSKRAQLSRRGGSGARTESRKTIAP